jgi:hypothetical protein
MFDYVIKTLVKMCLTYFTIFPKEDLTKKYRFVLAFNRE